MPIFCDILFAVSAGTDHVRIPFPASSSFPAGAEKVSVSVEIRGETLCKSLHEFRIRIYLPPLMFCHPVDKEGCIGQSFLLHNFL